MAAKGARKLREEASDEVARLGLKVQTLGAAFARAVESEEDNASTVIDNLLDPDVSLKTSLRGVVAFWIESFRVQERLRRDICTTLLDPPGGQAASTSTVSSGSVSWQVPLGVQATDPVAIDVPVAAIGGITVTNPVPPPNNIPPENVYVSLSSDGTEVEVALVKLENVLTTVGQTYTAQLNIPGGAPPIAISAVRIA